MGTCIKYCLNNDIKFKWINEKNIMNYINPQLFHGKNKIQLKKCMKE